MNEPTLTDAADRLAIRQTLVTEWRDDYSVSSLVNALAVTVAQIKVEAVDRERAAWATKVTAMADEFDRTAARCLDLSRVRAGLSDAKDLAAAAAVNGNRARDVRALLAADDTEGKP